MYGVVTHSGMMRADCSIIEKIRVFMLDSWRWKLRRFGRKRTTSFDSTSNNRNSTKMSLKSTKT